MAVFHYPAIVEGDRESGYSVFFPDLPGCTSGGATIQDAARNAEEALAGHVALMIEGGETVPEPGSLDDLPQPALPGVAEVARLLVRVGMRQKVPA
jgi:predicted RNase H-like HicB family nuclease